MTRTKTKTTAEVLAAKQAAELVGWMMMMMAAVVAVEELVWCLASQACRSRLLRALVGDASEREPAKHGVVVSHLAAPCHHGRLTNFQRHELAFEDVCE